MKNGKDGVFFPDKIDGRYFMFHRPSSRPGSGTARQSTRLATSDTITGEWRDLGTVLPAFDVPGCSESWTGAGSVPIPLGDKKYLVIYHSGNFHNNGEKEYDLNAALFDFSKFDSDNIPAIVTSRIEPLMVPNTEYETKAAGTDSEANTIFTCGSYEYMDTSTSFTGALIHTL